MCSAGQVRLDLPEPTGCTAVPHVEGLRQGPSACVSRPEGGRDHGDHGAGAKTVVQPFLASSFSVSAPSLPWQAIVFDVETQAKSVRCFSQKPNQFELISLLIDSPVSEVRKPIFVRHYYIG